VNPALLSLSQEQELAAALEAGVLLVLGYAPSMPESTAPASPRALGEFIASQVLEQYSRWGIPADAANASVALSPSCGMAGAPPGWARATYSALTHAGRLIREDAPVGEVTS
jgi:hypothetical protein